jgi:branched-chain amino acid transport system permease protein
MKSDERTITVRRAIAVTWPFPPLAVLVTCVALLGSLGPASVDRTVVSMLISVVLVVGLFTFIGNSGVFSFGHMAFMAIGAYASAILIVPPVRKEILFPAMFDVLRQAEVTPMAATFIGGLVAAAAAAIVAVPLMRLSGLTASLASFALLIMVNVVATNWKQVTNATSGISGLPGTVGVYAALLWTLGAVLLAALFVHTSSCLRLNASREDEVAARAVGIHIGKERGFAFVLSAFITGVGGGLFAQSIGSLTADSVYLTITFLVIAMLVVGGMHSLSGAVGGAVVLSLVSEFLRQMEKGVDVGAYIIEAPAGLREVGFALAMLAILIMRPAGLVGRREVPLPNRLRATRVRSDPRITADSVTQDKGQPAQSDGSNSEERGTASG